MTNLHRVKETCGGEMTTPSYPVEPDLIVTEMLAFPSKSSINKKDSDPINGKTIPYKE